MKNRRKVIMDCDPGVDDAVALAYAAANQEVFDILAITSVGGNQTIEKVTRNALDLVEFYGLDIPVARGMEGPLIREAVYAGEVHGKTGLGYCELPRASQDVVGQNAVCYLRKILMELPDGEKATLLPTGPLTNIALLLKLFPEVKEKIDEIILMGGAACGGNVTPSAEFNIYVDPEAARIVFHAGLPIVMCGLDATMKCSITREQIAKFCQSGDPVAKACGDMMGFSLENTNNKYRGVVDIHDAAPFMYIAHPEIFTVKKAVLDVDCSEGVSRGTTICDFRWWNYSEEEMTGLVMMDTDTEKFQEYLISAIYELGETVRAKKVK